MEELDLKELFNIFWTRKIEIIAIILIFMIIGFVYSFAFVEPKYSSYTTLLLTQVNSGSNDSNSSITQTDLTLNSKLVSTYSVLIVSKDVLREVINDLNINNLTEENLKNSIKVSAVTDTEMIKITITDKNPNHAEIIANKIAEVFSKKISDIYKINNVYIVDRAEASNEPSNINHAKDIIIFAFLGIVVACGYTLIVNMIDNTIKTEDDIEKVTGSLVLASIPDYDTEGKKGGKR